MFFAALVIALGVAILLNALGIFNSAFWGIFWGLFFIAVGIKLMVRRGKCPMCGWGMWHGKMHGDHCCDHDHDEDGQDHH